MPFAPSILEEDAKKVMNVVKNHKNPFMTISFDVKKIFQQNSCCCTSI